MLRPLKIIVGNMIVNAIISFYWQTQRDRHVKPHPTEILTPCHILTFSAFCPEAATVLPWGNTLDWRLNQLWICLAYMTL